MMKGAIRLALTISLAATAGCTGTPGPEGKAGPAGTTGATGAEGATSLIAVTDEAAGANCASGGQKIEVGLDADKSGQLESSEVSFTRYLCDGADGTNGAQGDAGTPGASGLNALVNATREADGGNCAFGGQRLDIGTDDNRNGTLESFEVDSTQYVCDGAQAAIALTSVTAETPGANCSGGGVRVRTGIDTNNNGTLETGEVQNTVYVCNGPSRWDDFSTIPSGTSGATLCTTYGYCGMTMTSPLSVTGTPKRLSWNDTSPPFADRWYADLSHSYLGGPVVAGPNGKLTWRAQIDITRPSSITAVIAVGGPGAVASNSWSGSYVACVYHDFFDDACTGCSGTANFVPDPRGAHLWEYRFDFNAGTWDFYLDNTAVRTGCTIPAGMNASRTISFFGDQGDSTNSMTAQMASWEIIRLP